VEEDHHALDDRTNDHVAVVTMNTNKVNAQNPAFFVLSRGMPDPQSLRANARRYRKLKGKEIRRFSSLDATFQSAS
jgi:hypothetical protein